MQDTTAVSDSAIDIYMEPDPDTIRFVPWYTEPTAQVICDAFHLNDEPVEISPRHVLRRVLQALQGQGLAAGRGARTGILSCEEEPRSRLSARCRRRAGRAARSRAARPMASTPPMISIRSSRTSTTTAKRRNWTSTRCSHESGPAQLEINFNHGDPLELADQVFLFKRTVRQAALKHDMYATFMAKPHENEPGSSMHIHQSVMDVKTGKNIFAGKDGKPSKLFLNHIGGLQRYLAAALLALRAQCEFLSPPGAGLRCADQCALGHRQPHRVAARAVLRSRQTCGSRTACRVPTPIPIWPLRRRWPAAISA